MEVLIMLTLYPAIFYRDKDDSFCVVFPDLNHLATEGEDLVDAMEMAVDCLAGYIFSLQQDGEVLPTPTPVENIDIHCENDEDFSFTDYYESAFVTLVAVNVKEYVDKHFEKPVKKTLTLPKDLNEAAISHNLNFSVVLKNQLLKVCGLKESDSTDKTDKKISVVADFGKTVKKTVTIPKYLNERASAMKVNFSAELQKGIISSLLM